MKLYYVIVILFFQTQTYSQGTLLDQCDSGTIIGYGTSKIGRKNLNSLFLGYSIKRKMDLGLETGLIGDDKLVGMSFSGYSGSKKPLNFRLSLFLAKKNRR